WLIVIACLVAFPPLGLILLLRKVFVGARGRKSSSGSRGAAYQQRPPQYRQEAQSGYASNPRGYYKQAAPFRPPYQAAGTAASARTAPSGQPHAQAEAVRRGKPGKSAEKKQTPARNLAIALTVLAVVLGILGVIFLSSGISALATAGISATNLGMTIFGAFSLLGAVLSGGIRGTVLKRISRFNKYAAVIGSREIMPVTEISKAVGESPKKTRKSLQAMIDSGFFGENAYIDSGLDSLVLSLEAAEKARNTAAAEESDASASAGSGNQYVAVINELHMLCSQTSDPTICEKIGRIEELTAKIFRLVEEKPEKLPQIRRFMTYYLPTTLKLLHSYQTLERQGIDGENITSTKQDIERILDTLAAGYEQQLDNLFKSDKLDISADINVLENLMEQDGLTSDGGIMKAAGGH
ncbi:5-bromo-4-chloroindolyl phosphate hydrolysis protein, partial [Sporobacter termitidis DSM 10068]